MTVSDLIQLADREGHGSNLHLKEILAWELIPQFLRDVRKVQGHLFWSYKADSLSVVASDTQKDLPTDFKRFRKIQRLGDDGSTLYGLKYIGDDPEKVLAATVASDQVAPATYYVERASTAGRWKIVFGAPSDGSYTIPYLYDWLIPVNPDTDTDLDDYIPQDVQGLLATRTRMEIFEWRFGQADKNYEAEANKYAHGLDTLRLERHAGRESKATYLR